MVLFFLLGRCALLKYSCLNTVKLLNCMKPKYFLVGLTPTNFITDLHNVQHELIKLQYVRVFLPSTILLMEWNLAIAYVKCRDNLSLTQINQDLDVQVDCSLAVTLSLAQYSQCLIDFSLPELSVTLALW